MKGTICYNGIKLSRYGICETDRPVGSPYSWGFCSRSCGVRKTMKEKIETGDYDEYEIMKATYFEQAPANSYFVTSSMYSIEVLY